MASIIALLPPSVRSAYGVIKRATLEGMASRELSALLQSHGVSIRRQSLLTIMREIKGVTETGSRVKNIPKSKMPDVSRFREALTPIRRQYGIVFKVTAVDANTGESVKRYVTYSFDQRKSMADIERDIMDMLEGDNDTYPLIDILITAEEGYRAGPKGVV